MNDWGAHMQGWGGKILFHSLNVIYALIIFLVGKWLAKVLSKLTERGLKRAHVEVELVHFLKNLVYFALLAFVVTAALGRLGIQTASFVAVVGAAGFAVGMALQGSLSNFAAGVMILIFKPFRIGDSVTAGGVNGEVRSIQIFSTIMITGDGVKIIIPNSQIMNGTVMNFTAMGKRRVDLKFAVAYSEDLDKVRKTILSVLSDEKRILPDPVTEVAVGELGESAVNFVVRPWVKTDDYWGVYFGLTEAIKKAFDRQNITIPFRQVDVNVRKDELIHSRNG